MQFEFLSPPFAQATDVEGNVTETFVIIKCDEPYTVLTGVLTGDWTGRSKDEVIEAVKEYNHKILFVDRAMSEAVLKVEEMDKKIQEVDTAIKSLKETEASIKQEAQVTQSTMLELIAQLDTHGLLDLSSVMGDE